MNFYDVLAAEKLGGGIPTTNFFDLLFAQFISGEKWKIYEGTLPATLNANGDNMRQYKIYGNTGGVGDRTENIYNTAETMWSADGTILDDNGNPTASSSHYTTNFTTVKPETTYYLSGAYRVGISTTRIYFYSKSKSWISRSAQIDTVATRVFTTPANCNFIQIQVANQLGSTAEWYIKEGTSPPETYAPYGYEVDMIVSDGTNTTTTPIYIGDTPLDKDEYVDYQIQKVYRIIDGILTPTDPPVPLPALPTCEGTTIVDYAGQSVAPEKVVFEYAKGGELNGRIIKTRKNQRLCATLV